MTEFHCFSAPTETSPGTLNPVYEILDFPIAMGGGDDVILTGPAPERPVIDGREVTDPRLIRALSKPVELDRAEVLDRSAKFAGVLRTLGVVPETGAVLTITEDAPPLARALAVLAAVRIGLRVDLRTGASAVGSGDDSGVGDSGSGDSLAEAADANVVTLHGIEAAPVEPGRASVKVTRSRFEGAGVTVSGQTADLDQAMRDSRVEFAAVSALSPDQALITTDAGQLSAQESLDWLRREVVSEP